MNTAAAILVCAGASTRMGGGLSKTLLPLLGQPVIVHTLTAFLSAGSISEIILVVRPEDKGEVMLLTGGLDCGQKPVRIVEGGETRQQSVKNGADAVSGKASFLAIHDGARPLITPGQIDGIVRCAAEKGAATMAVRVKDTIKAADGRGQVVSTPDRSALWAIQTPQVFDRTLYQHCAALAKAEYTDDCQLFEQAGYPVTLFEGSYRNLKITTPEDIVMAESLLSGTTAEKRGESMRIGHGYDVHRLVEGRRLILGGVEIPYEKGLLGHSDADVLAHAVSDALLGAAGLGDIGKLFPDTEEAYKDADSLVLLSRVCGAVREKGYSVSNIDATVAAQRPKLSPYIPEMRARIAQAAGLSEERINIKATTEEGLGFTGRGEGISAHAVCLIF